MSRRASPHGGSQVVIARQSLKPPLPDGVGTSTVYSRRIDGEKVGDQMSNWLNDNGPKMEKMLIERNNSPAPASLRDLPRTADSSR
jgi:hypothetical protein